MIRNDTVFKTYWKSDVVLRRVRTCGLQDVFYGLLESLNEERIIPDYHWGDLWMGSHNIKEVQAYLEREVIFVFVLALILFFNLFCVIGEDESV